MTRPLGTNEQRRARTRFDGDDILVEADDLTALRAAMNATCRWLKIILSVDEVS
ncbi:MAG: KEOPS complex subunit Pcc1 [Methanopyri archaeon]|nr:KEOPS complex subunit Pcc1 [Methanopyri archaeon]